MNGRASYTNPSAQQQQQLEIERQLAKLSPNELQRLRQKPNFEPIVTSFLQKQQFIQQQQLLNQQQMNNNSGFRNNLSAKSNLSMEYNQHPGNMPRAQNLTPTQQQTLQAQMNMRNTNAAALAATGARTLSGQSSRSIQIPLGPGAGSTPTISGTVSGTGIPRSVSSQVPQSKFATDQTYTNYPAVPPEIQNNINLSTLSSADEWSKKLKEEGKPIPLDLKLYENLVNKEMKHRSNSARQFESNKSLHELLMRDLRTYNEIKQLRMKAIQISSQNQFNNSIWGEGYQGYGNGISNTTSQNVLPNNRKRYSKIPDPPISEKELNKVIMHDLHKNPKRQLVPIRLEFEQERDRFKLRDTFLWDLNEKSISIEQFVGTLLEDYKFINHHYMEVVLSSVKEQIKDYRLKPDKTMGEIRIPIKINITINNTQYIDQFEWDILNFEANDPEEFSQIICDEMNLPGEFATAIVHNIREQTQLFHKALFLVGYGFDGLAINEDEIRSHLLPPLRLMSDDDIVEDYFSILRNPGTVSDYSPSLTRLTQIELERLDKEIEREARRKRRHNANDDSSLNASSRGTSRRGAFHGGRNGSVLPDLNDIPKTFRTPQPTSILPGGVDLGVPDVYSYNEVIVHRTQVANPEFKPPRPKIDRVIYKHDNDRGIFLVKIKY